MLQKKDSKEKARVVATKEKVAEEASLVVATKEKVAEETKLIDVNDKSKVADVLLEDPEVKEKAEKFVVMLLNPDTDNAQKRLAVDNLGAKTSEKAVYASQMLKSPLKYLKDAAGGKDPIAESLIDLTLQVEELDPVQLDKIGGFQRFLAKLPGFGHPVAKYFMKFESAENTIERIILSLKNGQETIARDNNILGSDQGKMREITLQLQKIILIGKQMDALLTQKLDSNEIPEDDVQFIETEILFPLRQRIQDLHQELMVNQQGYISLEIIIRNNRELVRGVNRACRVTMPALNIGVVISVALQHQKDLLDKITKVNKVTDDILERNVERIKGQGVAIQKQASETMLDKEKLISNFRELNSAIIDLNTFHKQALPKMAAAIEQMSECATAAEQTIQDIEKGNKIRSDTVIFDLDSV